MDVFGQVFGERSGPPKLVVFFAGPLVVVRFKIARQACDFSGNRVSPNRSKGDYVGEGVESAASGALDAGGERSGRVAVSPASHSSRQGVPRTEVHSRESCPKCPPVVKRTRGARSGVARYAAGAGHCHGRPPPARGGRSSWPNSTTPGYCRRPGSRYSGSRSTRARRPSAPGSARPRRRPARPRALRPRGEPGQRARFPRQSCHLSSRARRTSLSRLCPLSPSRVACWRGRVEWLTTCAGQPAYTPCPRRCRAPQLVDRLQAATCPRPGQPVDHQSQSITRCRGDRSESHASCARRVRPRTHRETQLIPTARRIRLDHGTPAAPH
jgi:hypothetical protein